MSLVEKELKEISVEKELKEILAERSKAYGSYSRNCKNFDIMYKAVKDGSRFGLLPATTRYALIVILMKINRLSEGGFHEDSLKDIAGYATLALENKGE